jgi:Putative peptidoglycan binding domain
MWFDLDLFGIRKRQLRNLDAAILLTDRMFTSLNGPPNGPYYPVPSEPSDFMLATQIRSLLDLVGRDLKEALLQEGSPFKATLDLPSQSIDRNALASALRSLQDLLESQRIVLLGLVKEDRAQRSGDALVGAPSGVATANGENPAEPARPNEASLLWNVTDKLYASWPIRIIFLAIGLAVALAMGGSYVIGGQTMNIRQDLDKAQERAQAEMRAISETTQSRLAKESETVLGSLRERGVDIGGQLQKAEKEVADLKTGSDKIKAEIVDKLQKSLKDEESSLRDAILKPLMEIRDKDISSLTGLSSGLDKTLKKTIADADDRKIKLLELGSKLDLLHTYADQSDKIGNALATINVELEAVHKSRMSAETEAGLAALKKTAAESSATDAEKFRQRASDAVKGASEETVKHNRNLALIENQLRGFEDKVKVTDGRLRELDNKQADVDGKQKASEGKQKSSDNKQKDTDGRLYVLDGQVSTEEEHLKSLKKRIDLLEKDVPTTPPTQIVQPPLAPILDSSALSPEDRMQVQRALATEGFPVGKIDGKFGGRTIAAIQAYQVKMKTEVTGRLTRDQFDALSKNARNAR